MKDCGMFVVVKSVIGRFDDNDEVVLVLDTEDLTVECVSKQDLINVQSCNGASFYIGTKCIKNWNGKSYNWSDGALFCAMVSEIDTVNHNISKSGLILYSRGRIWDFDRVKFCYECDDSGFTIVNNQELYNLCLNSDIDYVFKYKDYFVIRFVENDSIITIVIDRRGKVKCAYCGGNLLYGNKDLMVKLEMTITEY